MIIADAGVSAPINNTRQYTSYATITATPTNTGGSGLQYTYNGTAPETSNLVSQNSVTITFLSSISFAVDDQITITLSAKSTTSSSLSLEILSMGIGSSTFIPVGSTKKNINNLTSDWCPSFTVTFKARVAVTLSKLTFKMATTTHSPLAQIKIESIERV